MDRATLAGMIDHTLLRPDATDAEVAALCGEAKDLGVAAVCVSPSRLPLEVRLHRSIAVAAVVGFPSGAHSSATKVAEARGAVGAGATEIDMVLDLGLVRAHRWVAVGADVAAVRAAVPSVVLKVIIETAALQGTELETCCASIEDAGADFVKTSTGFHPAGGATIDAVHRIAAAVGGRLGVKASGGIRDAHTALAMVDAGATRLGCSATRRVLDGV